MIRTRRTVALAAALGLGVSMTAAAQQQPYRVNDQQAQELVNRINTRTDTFRASFGRAIDLSRIRGSRAADGINQSVADFQQATYRLRDRVNDRGAAAAAVEDVLKPAAIIDTFMKDNQLDAPAERDWQAIMPDLDQLARVYGVPWNRTGWQNSPSAASGQPVEQLISQTTKDVDQFRLSLDQALARGRINTSRDEDDVRRFLTELTESTYHLNDHVDRRQIVANNVDDVMEHGVSIDSFMQRHPLTPRAQSDWLIVRRDLDGLARSYNVAWDWNNPRNTVAGSNAGGVRDIFSGTYKLDTSRGDDPRQAATQATRSLPPGQRDRAYQSLLNRLQAPDVIALDREGNRVSMASSRGPRVTFDADGQVRTEQASGTKLNTRATFHGDQLLLTTAGAGKKGNDFTVTFEPIDAGANLRVTRRILEDGRLQPVTVASFYRKSSDQARWDVYSPAVATSGSNGSSVGNLVVPAGTRLTATLNENLSTKTTHDGDRFSMTVSSPSQYNGAVIEGLVSSVNASGRVSGKADMALNFQTIGQRNGRASEFAGVIDSMRTPGGEAVQVNNEGNVEATDSQTEKTVTRGTVGGALGAIIGAIAGGGKGAAIGAVIGAGGGAGTVVAQGRDQLDLQRGTEVTITSGAAVGGAR